MGYRPIKMRMHRKTRLAEAVTRLTKPLLSPLQQRDRPLPFDDLGCAVIKHNARVLVQGAKARVGWCEDDPRVTPDLEYCPSCGKPRT
jgi:hypothetical protein